MSRSPIVVPLDGSAAAEAALPYAEAIARPTSTPLSLLAVVDVGPPSTPAASGLSSWGRQIEAQTREPLTRYLDGVVDHLARRGVSASAKVVTGRPAEEILAEATWGEVSMVIMATHGRDAAEWPLIGSVAATVMRLGIRPTLLVPPRESTASHASALRRIMAPLDGSPLAEAAATAAADLTATLGASLSLVRVEPRPAVVPGPARDTADGSRPDEPRTVLADADLPETRPHAPGEIPVAAVVLRGDPAEALPDFALRRGIDLVVMATYARGGAQRLLLGRLAAQMVHARLPVLLVPPPIWSGRTPEMAGSGRARRRGEAGRRAS